MKHLRYFFLTCKEHLIYDSFISNLLDVYIGIF